MYDFAVWLSETAPSIFIQSHAYTVIPIVQSVHIVSIAVVLGSVLMINLRILGWAGTDRPLSLVHDRFAPWQKWGLVTLLLTGLIMIIGEPVRQVLAFSFWAKMSLVLIGTFVAIALSRSLTRNQASWDAQSAASGGGLRVLALVTLLIWVLVIVMGRLIAYDYLWGSLSPGM